MKGEQPPIAYPADIWLNSQLSVARYSGGIKINGSYYYIVGEEHDLVCKDFIPIFKKLGRTRFYETMALLPANATPTMFKEAARQQYQTKYST